MLSSSELADVKFDIRLASDGHNGRFKQGILFSGFIALVVWNYLIDKRISCWILKLHLCVPMGSCNFLVCTRIECVTLPVPFWIYCLFSTLLYSYCYCSTWFRNFDLALVFFYIDKTTSFNLVSRIILTIWMQDVNGGFPGDKKITVVFVLGKHSLLESSLIINSLLVWFLNTIFTEWLLSTHFWCFHPVVDENVNILYGKFCY